MHHCNILLTWFFLGNILKNMINILKKKIKLKDIIKVYADTQVKCSVAISEATKRSTLARIDTINFNFDIGKTAENIKFRDIEAFKAKLLVNNNVTTTNSYISLFKRIMRWAVRMEYIPNNFDLDIFSPAKNYAPTKPVKYITTEQFSVLKKILENLTDEEKKRGLKKKINERTYYATCILALTGIRPRELTNLLWKDINFDTHWMVIRSSCATKGVDRKIKISKIAFNIINKMPRFHGHHVDPFYNITNGTNAFKNRLNNIKKKFDLDFSPTPYIFRKSFATWVLANKHLHIQELSAYLGHSDISTTAKYYTNREEILDRAAPYIDKLSFEVKPKTRKVAA